MTNSQAATIYINWHTRHKPKDNQLNSAFIIHHGLFNPGLEAYRKINHNIIYMHLSQSELLNVRLCGPISCHYTHLHWTSVHRLWGVADWWWPIALPPLKFSTILWRHWIKTQIFKDLSWQIRQIYENGVKVRLWVWAGQDHSAWHNQEQHFFLCTSF